ncbi:toll-like receptor 2 [Sinocyclocheilus grahami]|uniref:toll-like receptor 2 n=1 Tax=Sinocyclocheilus grahami TaxID=75366 RepID=UPI0007AD19A0|nr:PREDICTED: toll-like receptor 2 [Sinocyclocheilus grahami]
MRERTIDFICIICSVKKKFISVSLQAVVHIKPTKANQSCKITSDRRSADCKGLRLDHVPITNLTASLEELDLSFNTIQVISKQDLFKLSHLRVLMLNFNNISLIVDDAFHGNIFLENLNLFNNSLTEIPFKALKPLTNLKVLEMSNNLYTQASLDASFLNFTKLKVLSIGGSLVNSLGSHDIYVLKNISLDKFAIKTGTGFKSYEPGYFSNLDTKNLWFDIAFDKKPDMLPMILKDLANKTFDVLRFRNLFEFQYYTGKQDIFSGLQYVKTQLLTFYRGKFNEEVMRMALVNLEISSIKGLELLLIDFARSQNRTQGSSVTNLTLEKLVLSDISNPDIMRFDWSFTWLNHVRQFIVWNVNFNSVPCDSWPEMQSVELLDISNNQLRDSYIYNPLCDIRNALHKLETFKVSRNRLTSLSDLASLTKDFVIFVLSRNFVNSEWCNYELYFAQQRAIGKTFSDVILIVKEPIDPTSLPSKFCKLKRMLNTKTYLEWPQQPTEQSFFWVQLRSVLGQPNIIRQRTTSRHSRLSSVRSVSLIELPQDQSSAGTDEDGHQISDEPSNRCQQTLENLLEGHK